MTTRRLLWLLVAALAAAPLVLGDFSVTLLNYVGIYALVALGLVLLTGFGGLTSFGQAAFVGIGAYATAWLTTAQAASPWLGLLLALALTGSVALILGAITLRLEGHFLPLSTIAWGIAIYYLFGQSEALGRHGGIAGIPPLAIGPLSFARASAMYYPIWLLLAGALWLCANLLDSREGRAIRSLRGGKAMAAMDGRFSVSLDDVRKVAVPVLRHRISTNFQAQAEGQSTESLVQRLVAEIREPDTPKYDKGAGK